MTECCICLGVFQDRCDAPCGHAYCRDCILHVLGSSAPEWSGNCPLCRSHISVYNLRDSSGERLAKPAVESIYGCIFVQAGKLGAASYHFDSEEDCYISYADAPPFWLLDDGNTPPVKKPWSEAVYDKESLTFTGVIHWDPPFQGDVRWDYEIVFAEDLSGVVGGKVVSTAASGSRSQTPFTAPWDLSWDRGLAYLRWTPPPSSIFGSVYVQGTMYASFLEGVASYHFISEEECYISYSNAPSIWRLDDGSRPPVQKPFREVRYDAARRTFRATVTWDPPFMGQSRWEYEMVFSEDYSCICGGRLQAQGVGGAPLPDMSFQNPIGLQDQRRVAGRGLYYVKKPGALVLSEHARTLLPRPTDADTAASVNL
mmetsp:Transcript_32775/g.59920  ORF Transcript_32775/g.59920 Transcript_32775/m.59920 type:complete len:370 (+) Transcript_32775:56-1165(+)